MQKHIVELKEVIGEYSFFLEELPENKIKVRLFRYLDFNQDQVYFETSHYMQTPTQAGAYITSNNCRSTKELALNGAIETITSFYTSAIENGYKPKKSWLVKNTFFNE